MFTSFAIKNNKMKKYIFYALLLISSISWGQEKRDYNWIIGYDDNSSIPGGNAIMIDFNKQSNNISNIVTVDGFNMEGSNTSMSDVNGNLLFYSNGCYIVNAAHEIMENGDSINPGWMEQYYCSEGGSPYIQGVLALPAPESDSLYYLFVLDMLPTFRGVPNVFGIAPEHLYYNVINKSASNGLGKVIAKNQTAIQDTFARGNIQATKHANGKDWWVVVPKVQSNCYHILPITKDGIGTPKLECLGRPWDDSDGGTQTVFSPNGKKFARMNGINGLHIYDFNNTTGALSNPVVIDFPDHEFGISGLAISPNSRFIYASAYTKVFQFDLQAQDIAASRILIAEWDGYQNPGATIFYIAALAPDGKIYIASTSSTYNLHVINQPNCPGTSCDLVQHGVVLPSFNFATIPNFPHYRDGSDVVNEPCITAINEIENKNISIQLYPNPTSTTVTIQLPTNETSTIQLFDVVGTLIKKIKITQSATIDVSDLPGGLYFCTWQDKNGVVFSEKLIVQK